MRWLFRYEGDKNFSLMKHTPLLFNSSALVAGVNSVRLHIFWRFQKRICDLRSYGFFTAKKMEDPKTEDHLPFFAWQRRARNASDCWWTARDHGKLTDGGRSAVSPVVSFPPSFARTSKERRLGTRRWQRHVLVLLVMRKIEEKQHDSRGEDKKENRRKVTYECTKCAYFGLKVKRFPQ